MQKNLVLKKVDNKHYIKTASEFPWLEHVRAVNWLAWPLEAFRIQTQPENREGQ